MKTLKVCPIFVIEQEPVALILKSIKGLTHFLMGCVCVVQKAKETMTKINVRIRSAYKKDRYQADIEIDDIQLNGVRIEMKSRTGKPWINMPAYKSKERYIKAVALRDGSELESLVYRCCIDAVESYDKNPYYIKDDDMTQEQIYEAIEALPFP